MIACRQCATEFSARSAWNRYCSIGCASIGAETRRLARIETNAKCFRSVTCRQCSATFTVTGRGSNRHYCSAACRKVADAASYAARDARMHARYLAAKAAPAPVRPMPPGCQPQRSSISRRLDCANLRVCLDYAVSQNWQGFSCGECSGFVQAERAPLQIRVSSAGLIAARRR